MYISTILYYSRRIALVERIAIIDTVVGSIPLEPVENDHTEIAPGFTNRVSPAATLRKNSVHLEYARWSHLGQMMTRRVKAP